MAEEDDTLEAPLGPRAHYLCRIRFFTFCMSLLLRASRSLTSLAPGRRGLPPSDHLCHVDGALNYPALESLQSW
jgi:hypothetical protein